LKRIAVVGASGFVGSSLVEQLHRRGPAEIVPFIHSSGNAWRLARLGIELRTLDLLDKEKVVDALRGITHVVNCTRGGDEVMLRGLKHLLAASKSNRVERFVHLGSVAVYGDPPPAQSEHEDAPTEPDRGSYGWIKLQQDRMVQSASREGLQSVILCPPNISGTHSIYLLSLLDALNAEAFALLEDGSAPCNLVDVRNLVHAIELALSDGPKNGQRLFVTDDERTTWQDVVGTLMRLAESARWPRSISRDELSHLGAATGGPQASILKSMKHVVSSDVRQALRKDPLWHRFDTALRRGIARMGKPVESALRTSVEGPILISKVWPGPSLNTGLCRQQLRGVLHSCDAAKGQLGYRPILRVAESMSVFSAWYRYQMGMESGMWPLLRQIPR